ncbi:hypothetical protein [Chelativorans sp. Marseille-P2723]|uniref:hypothetical protein n=1 Tax=Chelativorans sp. Marseille-P2723 TaxID=2709133 RepID=UPI00156F9B4E|nr:hypothetical protein [Chelativorans sp. Marseille-P2723]
MRSTLADMLPDFGTGNGAHQARAGSDVTLAQREPLPEEVTQQRIAQEIAAAEAALSQKLACKHAEALSAERERHAAEMQATIERLSDLAAEAIAARFDAMKREVASITSALAAQVLAVTLTQDVRRRSIEELARLVGEAMNDRDTLRVRVRGPENLRQALKERLGEQWRQIDFIDAVDFDLTAEIGESLLKTRLADWSEELAEVLP